MIRHADAGCEEALEAADRSDVPVRSRCAAGTGSGGSGGAARSRRGEWTGPSVDSSDEQFGDVVRPVAPEDATGGAVPVGGPFDRGVVGRPGAAVLERHYG